MAHNCLSMIKYISMRHRTRRKLCFWANPQFLCKQALLFGFLPQVSVVWSSVLLKKRLFLFISLFYFKLQITLRSRRGWNSSLITFAAAVFLESISKNVHKNILLLKRPCLAVRIPVATKYNFCQFTRKLVKYVLIYFSWGAALHNTF